jgi:predicted nucleotidyltransferase
MTAEVATLRAFFERRAPAHVLAAYLFGSRLKGRAVRESDLDVGVVVEPDAALSTADRFDLRVQLASDLMATLRENEVDVNVLNELSPAFAALVLREGKLVFCRDTRRLQEFARDVQLRAADLQLFLRRNEKILLRALAGR